jgi:beta-phosphoglucomutase-like phosphatase (HAD superfamily)
MDGTLVDTEPLWRQAERALVSSFGYSLEPALQAGFEGQDVDVVVNTLREAYALPGEVDALARVLNEWVVARLGYALEVAGAPEVVRWVVERGLKRAVVSNSPQAVIGATLARHPWAGALGVRVAIDMALHGKPAPDLYLLAAERLRVHPRGCVVIEDSPVGVAAAVAAGMTCLAVPRSDYARVALQSTTPYLLESLADALAWLRARLDQAGL